MLNKRELWGWGEKVGGGLTRKDIWAFIVTFVDFVLGQS